MKHTVVTGATGEVGLALVEELLTHDIPVTVVSRPGSKRISRLAKHPLLDIVDCPLDEIHNLSSLIHYECDVFYHLAWDYSRAHNDVERQFSNIGFTLDAVRAAKDIGCRTFIGAGSQAEYGPTEDRIDESTPTRPNTAYGMAKLCAGQMSRLLCSQVGIRHIWPRIFSVYGPGDAETTMIISVIRKLLAGEKPELSGGEQVWDYLYSKDCAKAMRLLGEQGEDGKVYCISGGNTRLLKDYIAEMRDVIDPDLELGFGLIPYSKGQVMRLDVDISELVRDTGFEPTYTFSEGIIETINWCRDNPVILKPEEL